MEVVFETCACRGFEGFGSCVEGLIGWGIEVDPTVDAIFIIVQVLFIRVQGLVCTNFHRG